VRKIFIIIAGILNSLCIIAVIVCAVFLSQIKSTLLTQQTAERWGGDSELRFAQVSAFFRTDESTSVATIDALRAKVATALTESSLKAPEGGRLFTDAFSTEGRVTLSRGKDQTTVSAYGIGGDFFLFHPLELLSGGYIWGSDLMKDRIVLDERIAWRFFGSSDVAGMEIMLNGNPFIIAGVIRPEADEYSQRVISGDPCVYVDYSVLSTELSGEGLAASTSSSGINCYEIVMPNPISNYAVQTLRQTFSSDSIDIVENTSRYDSARISYLMKNFGSRSAENTGILYPYWENAARLSEDYTALLTFIRNFFLILPLLTAAFLAVLGVLAYRKRRTAILGSAKSFFVGIIDRRRTKRYERRGHD